MSETSDRESATKSRDIATPKSGRDRMPSMPDASVFSFGPIAGHATPLEPTSAAASIEQAAMAPTRLSMFDRLVTSESDVVGLVAYGIYKYSKRDWAAAFAKAHGRAPDAGEVDSFTLGETTDRRAATYLHLAENMVSAAYTPRGGAALPQTSAKRSDPAAAAKPRPRGLLPQYGMTAARSPGEARRKPSWLVVAYLAVLILFLVGLVVLVRTGSLPFGMGRR